MRYHWQPADNSYSLLEFLVTGLKVLGGLTVVGGILLGIAVAADSSDGTDDSFRAGWAIGCIIGSIVYGALIAGLGAAIDVGLGLTSTITNSRADELDRDAVTRARKESTR
jgi:hypothetical protein